MLRLNPAEADIPVFLRGRRTAAHFSVQKGERVFIANSTSSRADVFRPPGSAACPVIMSYGPYAKGLSFQQGYASAWQQMVEQFSEVTHGSSGLYQNWEVVDPELGLRSRHLRREGYKLGLIGAPSRVLAPLAIGLLIDAWKGRRHCNGGPQFKLVARAAGPGPGRGNRIERSAKLKQPAPRSERQSSYGSQPK